jgi:type VI secretion system secreted protein VgrG
VNVPLEVQLEIATAKKVSFVVGELRGREAIHEPFRFVVRSTLLDADSGSRATVDASAWVGHKATLSWKTADGEQRRLETIVDEISFGGDGADLALLPRLGAGPDGRDYRVFVDEDSAAIATKVLGEHHITVDAARLERTPPERPQVIQQFEADLDFVARILADDGIAYVLSSDGAKVILIDRPERFEALPKALPIRDDTAALLPGHAVFRPRLTRRRVVQEVALRDYDFEKPQLDLSARHGNQAAGLTVFEHLAGFRDVDAGKRLAETRLSALAKHELVLEAESNAPFLRAGAVLEIEEGPRSDLNGKWLLVEVSHDLREDAGDRSGYMARFRALPLTRGFRPDRRAAPRLGGVEHATVVGATKKAGGDLYTEAHARVRVSHRWDRHQPADKLTSSWVRTTQPNTFGSIFVPRLGWETLVGFVNGRGDEPLVLGRLYNATTPPPVSLPGGKVESALTSRTVSGGSGANRVGTNDSAGGEGLGFDASKDYNERTSNDKETEVKQNDIWDIGQKHKLAVGTTYLDEVKGARKGSVKERHEINVGANYSLKAADEFVHVRGLRLLMSGGNNGTVCSTYYRLVAGAAVQVPIEHQTRSVLGNASLVINTSGWRTKALVTSGISVGGVSTHIVDGEQKILVGQYSCNVKGPLDETYSTRTVDGKATVADNFKDEGTFHTEAAATFEGGKVVVKAAEKISLQVGGVTIDITGGSIIIDGKLEGESQEMYNYSDNVEYQ